MNLQSVDLVAIGPPLVVAIAALVILLADLALPASSRRRREQVATGLMLAGLLAGLGWAIGLAASGPRSTFCSAAGCYYAADGFTAYLQILVLAAVALVVGQ